MAWSKSYQKYYPNINPDRVWNILTDVNNWPTWHDDLDDCKLEGEFKVGNHFYLTPKGSSAVKIVLTEINENKSFTDCTKFFGAKMYDTHRIEIKDDGIILTNKVVVTGLLRWLWVKLVAQNVADTSLQQMDALVELARNKVIE